MLVGKFYTCLLLLAFSIPLAGQTLRGKVTDASGGAGLEGVTLILKSDRSEKALTCVSNAEGQYRIDSIQPGYYQITARLTGYNELTIREIQVNAGKERVLDLLLEAGTALGVVEILEDRYGYKMQPLGAVPLTRDQNLRYPMTYNDPARLATAFAGVAQTDDGTNSISVRGNNPGLMRWRLEGVDIVSPNHLPNAGTLSDQTSLASGGVLMLSSQMLDNATLHKGNYSAQYGDAIAGIMDLTLRKGNNQHQEATVQAGLIGLDIAVEGPFTKGKSSYLINYRYSTVGLLGAMGVKFGNEKITFQDLAFNLYFPTKGVGEFTVFGLFGKSENIFKRPDTASVYKELFNIDYDCNGGAFGFTHFVRLNKNLWWRTSSASSFQNSDRYQVYANYSNSMDQHALRMSNTTMLNYSFSPSWQFRGGMTANYMTFGYSQYINKVDPDFPVNILRDMGVDEGNAQLWVQSETKFSNDKGLLQIGLHGSLSSYGVFDPRFLLSYWVHPQHRLTAAVGLYSQISPFPTSVFEAPMMRSSQYAIRHNWIFGNQKWIWRTELFRQGISKVLVNGSAPDSYSTLNETEPILLVATSRNGTGANYGIETGIERYFNQGWYLNGNLTLLHSEASGSDNIARPTRWDVGQIVNLTAGKEWSRKLRNQKIVRVFGANARAVYMGGYRAYPINQTSSASMNETIFLYDKGPTEHLPDYYRIDGRVYWKRSIGNRRNSTFAFEFQNLSFRKNVAYYYYEPFTQKIETKYQLGLIPNLNWRLEI